MQILLIFNLFILNKFVLNFLIMILQLNKMELGGFLNRYKKLFQFFSLRGNALSENVFRQYSLNIG